MPYDEALKMKSMIDLQWTMISCLALSGAAGSPKPFYEPSQPDDDVSQTQDAQEDPRESCSPSRPGSVQNLPTRTHPGSPQHQTPVHEDGRSGSMCRALHDHPCHLKAIERGRHHQISIFDCEWGRSAVYGICAAISSIAIEYQYSDN